MCNSWLIFLCSVVLQCSSYAQHSYVHRQIIQLTDYRNSLLEKMTTKNDPIRFSSKILIKPGDRSELLPMIADRLKFWGYYKGNLKSGDHYDNAVQKAVK